MVEYKYDAWGNIISQTGGSLADINPYRYRGYRYDVETGLYYLQSRYYDPAIGRFISADGLLGEIGNLVTHNMYAYCGNNPVMHVDPNGESFLLVAGAVFLGGLIGGLIGVFTATDDEKLLGAFVGGFINGAICTVGLAAAIATGGTSAFAIAGVSGFFGGFVGNSINQLISGSDYNFGNALFSGGVSAIANMAALWGFNQFLTPIGTTWGKRFVEAILPSTIGVAIQVYNGLHIRDPFIYSKKSHFSHLREESNNIVIDFA